MDTELVLSLLFFFLSCFDYLVPIMLSGNVGLWQCLCLSQFHAFLLLNNIPSYVRTAYTTFSLSIHVLRATGLLPPFGGSATVNIALCVCLVPCF